mmetsp:Transcript_38125/g.74680  ORF Transcript_38125/g.74680 Transcript_38125/m.74680 type:complete len:111 (+) Transcript_38125:99-431(+)
MVELLENVVVSKRPEHASLVILFELFVPSPVICHVKPPVWILICIFTLKITRICGAAILFLPWSAKNKGEKYARKKRKLPTCALNPAVFVNKYMMRLSCDYSAILLVTYW